jgi:cephalosporin hydroxylase
MKTLREIYNSYKHLPVCDKGTTHSYIEKYEEILAPYRDRPITLVEIGVESGGSLAMWAEYFANPLSRII